MYKNSYTKDLADLLEARAHNGDSAFKICALLEAELIVILCRCGLGRFDAEQLLYDAIREHERALFAALRSRIHLDDAIDAVHQVFGAE